MDFSYLRYELEDGYIHNWLVAGPQRIPAADLESSSTGYEDPLAAPESEAMDSGVTDMPVEHSRFLGVKVMIGDYEGSWSYLRTEEDHFVDLSEITPTPQVLRAWAYTQVDVPTARNVTLVLTSYSPADVWVNEIHVHHHSSSHLQAEHSAFDVPFSAGHNTVLIRFEQEMHGARPCAVALRVQAAQPDALNGAAVVIPTTIEPVKRRRELERTLNAAHLRQTVFERHDDIFLDFDAVVGRWANGFAIRLQAPDGQTYAETEVGSRPTDPHEATLGKTFSYPERFYHAVLVPTNEEYVNQRMWATRRLPLWTLNNNSYSDVTYGELVERRFEALKHASRYSDDVFAEMAKMAVSWWSVVEPPVILRAIDRVNAHEVGSARELLGLLGILIRFSALPEFPEVLKAPLEEAVLGYVYTDAAAGGQDGWRETEGESLLLRVCEVLAGQHYADRTFAASGQSGAWHREEGRQQLTAWLRRRAAGGYAAWDSDIVFAEVIAGLIHLVEFAEDDDVWEMATALLDKTLYSLALNTFKGSFGSTRGLTEMPQLLHGMLEATSGICRLMWGMGVFNAATAGYVSLACADQYGFPELIQVIATDIELHGLGAVWSRERHAPEGAGVDDVKKVMYRTPDYMLSSVQDYHPGAPGSFEHVWQATLGPAARVFVNHPASASLAAARRPNFWRGNGSLPRVAQWQDALMAIYNLPEDDWMGFTHAYFPAYAFDATVIRDDAGGLSWAFAQKGAGYVALTALVDPAPRAATVAPQAMTLSETGPHTGRELRIHGRRVAWLCQMGREAQDGTFVEFQEAVLGLAPTLEDLSVRMPTLRGDTLTFGWTGPLLRNGEPEPDRVDGGTGFRHFESMYGIAELPAEELVIVYGEQALRLHLK